MPLIQPIRAIRYTPKANGDVSPFIAPPYDVIDQAHKNQLLQTDPHNVVAIDLPHLPAKTAGPDAVYKQANVTFRQWLHEGVLVQQHDPAVFVYQQTYTAPGNGTKPFKRRGLMANVPIQPFGQSIDGHGAIHPHEQTFSGPKEDRMKLMCATQAQLSPIFGLYSDQDHRMHDLLKQVVESGRPSFFGHTPNDGVLHEMWTVDDPNHIARFTQTLSDSDIFIADGHHRYSTALNHRQQLIDAGRLDPAQANHPANACLFVLVAMQDPGMIVLPTHRVLGGMTGFSIDQMARAAKGKLQIHPFAGHDLAALAQALPAAGQHAIGLYDPAQPNQPLAIATTVQADPLAQTHGDRSTAWRQLDVAIAQHLVVEAICQPNFCPPGQPIDWKFPHSVSELKTQTDQDGFQLGLVMQATPLESVRQVSEAGELMPQKSTFFYPKIATGLAIHPLA